MFILWLLVSIVLGAMVQVVASIIKKEEQGFWAALIAGVIFGFFSHGLIIFVLCVIASLAGWWLTKKYGPKSQSVTARAKRKNT